MDERFGVDGQVANGLKEGLILLVIPAKAGIQRLQAVERKDAGFLLSQE